MQECSLHHLPLAPIFFHRPDRTIHHCHRPRHRHHHRSRLIASARPAICFPLPTCQTLKCCLALAVLLLHGFETGGWLREVMDSFPQEPNDVKSKLPGPSALLLSRVISAPEPRRHDGPFSTHFDLTPRKRDSPMDRPYQRSATELSSPPARHFWPSAASSPPQDDNTELSVKRPRLDYVHERADGIPDAPKTRLKQYVCMAKPYSTGGFRDSPADGTLHPQSSHYVYPEQHEPSAQTPTESSPFRPSFGSCHICYGTDGLVVDLVRAFLDLQTEMSHALSISLGSGSPIEVSGILQAHGDIG